MGQLQRHVSKCEHPANDPLHLAPGHRTCAGLAISLRIGSSTHTEQYPLLSYTVGRSHVLTSRVQQHELINNVVSFTCQGAADLGTMNQLTHLRLNLGLMTLSGLGIGLHFAAAPVLSLHGMLTGLSLMAPTFVVPAFHYQRCSGHGLDIGPVLKVQTPSCLLV